MKVFIVMFAYAACCLAADTPFYQTRSQDASLPLQQPTKNITVSTTVRPASDGEENFEGINPRVTEGLKQEDGSQRGVYHVILQDGRLQRVQYVTVPAKSGQPGQKVASNIYNKEQNIPEILSPDFEARRSVYFVQVPQERIEAIQVTNKQVAEEASPITQAFTSAQYSEQEPSPVNVKYLPYEETVGQSQFVPSGFSSQFRQEQAADEAVVRYLPIQLGEDSNQNSKQQVEQPAGSYLANVQYSQVEPIQGPVYSYQPQALTRILRYAPVY